MNHLAGEKSPYLLQHASNPVDWYPWGDLAFQKARETARPIFLSIGYSTCHWCHVMEHESFEDAEVAALMNDNFISVKVDREERPDLDAHYMTACQLMTGTGGWPLTIVMTPEGTPFFAGTYIPKETSYGSMGLLELLPRISELWDTRRADLVSSAQTVAAALSEEANRGEPGGTFDRRTVVSAALGLSERYDSTHGGFGTAPKFPMANLYPLLLRAWSRGRDERTLAMVEGTLSAMRNGGIYDQVGFGFHRYSTDRQWLVPHFEKMLYDQALLCLAYTDAWLATGKDLYARTAKEICLYVLRDLALPDGAFSTAEDADSEGEEGKFYLWTRTELQAALPEDEFGGFVATYSLDGDGEIILHRDPSQTAAPGRAEELLLSAREKRTRPSRDDKVLADWNGLMIAALARAGGTFEEPAFCAAAAKAADFILGRMRGRDGRLFHRSRDGETAIGAFADDYAFLAWGLLELYEATFNVRHLERAIECSEALVAHYRDQESGGLFRTADDAAGGPVDRTKPLQDGVIPSANSVGLLVFTKLAEITGSSEWRSRAESIVRQYPSEAGSSAMAFAFFLSALDFFLGPAIQVVVAGDPGAEDTKAMVRALRRLYLPNATLVLRPTDGSGEAITRIAPYTKPQGMLEGKATSYVCTGWSCTLPTNSVETMLARLDSLSVGSSSA